MKISACLRVPVFSLSSFALLGLSAGQLAIAAEAPKITIEKEPTGVVMQNGTETLHVTVCGPSLLHVVAGPGDPKASSPQQPWIVAACPSSPFEFVAGEKEDTLSTSRLRVTLNHENGSLNFKDSAGGQLLQENGDHPRRYVPVVLNGENVHQVSDRFMPAPEEGLYGLGQHQAGIYNYRGAVIELAQNNTDVAFPFMVSSKGYGMLWNTASKSWVDNRFPSVLKLTAEAGDAIDYYFVYGPELDEVIHQYRQLTGQAPLFPEVGLRLLAVEGSLPFRAGTPRRCARNTARNMSPSTASCRIGSGGRSRETPNTLPNI